MTQTLQLIDSYFDTLDQDDAFNSGTSQHSISTEIERVDVPVSEDCLDQLQASLECYQPDCPLDLERRIVEEMASIRSMMR